MSQHRSWHSRLLCTAAAEPAAAVEAGLAGLVTVAAAGRFPVLLTSAFQSTALFLATRGLRMPWRGLDMAAKRLDLQATT